MPEDSESTAAWISRRRFLTHSATGLGSIAHATVLHLLGLDHTRLTYYHNGIQRRLTDVHGHVLDPILA